MRGFEKVTVVRHVANHRGKGFRVAGILLLLPLFPLLLFSVPAAEGADLPGQIEKELRSAERAMFGGKKEESDSLLKEASRMLEELSASDPSNVKLKTLQSKYEKIRRDLDKRMGSSSPAPSRPAPAAATKPAAPPAPRPSGPGADPRAVERAVAKAGRDVDFALGKLERLMTDNEAMLAVKKTVSQKEEEARRYVEEARGYLGKTLEKYGEAVDAGSETIREIAGRIDRAEGSIGPWLKEIAGAEKQQSEAAAAAAVEKEKTLSRLKADAERMEKLYENHYGHFEHITGNTLVYGMEPKDAEKALAVITEAENDLPELASELGRLAGEYGRDPATIYNKFHDLGFRLENNENGHFAELVEAVGKLSSTRRESAKTVETNARSLLSAFSGQLTDARLERMQKVKAMLVLGGRIDPDNAEVAGMLSGIDDQIAEAADRMTAAIDAAKWPGHVKDFPGPGSVKKLAEEALGFFRNHPNWKSAEHRYEVLAVAVRGPWQVAERDIFGRVVSWRLPALVASTDERFRPRNIARVLEVSILAMEGQPDKAPKAPPFAGYWVGDNYMMRLSKLE